ncbi:transcriptional regulator ATRX homolog isoform X2 [Phymastichus coffea]|uniref:transcriptional regulator ATRX homolog isoform X2 n=1 Tax=Phymastichus coffea TaxID=108790 RepID=UPI00273BC335|nr:transcriptional regulator ATRX homolog isoform X2 [Phymastichus coffea]
MATKLSSSSDDGEEVRSTRRSRNKLVDGAAALRTATLPRRKMDKFELRNNRYYLADEKLRRKCRVKLERLPESELAKYARALEKSKKHVEHKKIQSLANLDNLESQKNSKKNLEANESSELNADNVKQTSKNKKLKEDAKLSVADFLNKTVQPESNESSNEIDDTESQNALAPVDTSFDQSSSIDAEIKAKEALLRSSSSSSIDIIEDEMSVDGNCKKQKTDHANDNNKASPSNDDNDEKDIDQKQGMSSWKKDKLLTFKLDGSETEEEQFSKSQEKKKAKQLETENDKSQEPSSLCKKVKSPRKTRKTRRILDSDSDVKSISEDQNENSFDEESNQEEKKNNNKKKRQRSSQSSDSESSSSKKKQKAKRRRIKKVASDSDSDDKDSPGKGRKNIRRVLKDKYVTDDTKKAAQDEEERLKRIAERQKLFNEMYEIRLAGEEKVDKLVLDIDKETKEELVVVDNELAKRLKPHQARGIKFMWDACFESIEQIKKSDGSGCIVAHCMGLGKTFQVVTLAHTLLSNEKTGVKTVMVVCPLSTVLNWVNEFNIWLKHVNNRDDIEIHEMTKLKKNIERKHKLESWQKYGGILIIGYEMFRNLTSTGKKLRKNMQESIMKSLVDPGADLVVCDEGHLLKNEDSALSKAMKLVKTMRRVILTGTPLQNNLKEYHCMVQFVKPNLLGTKKEFLNRFVNPITNGQFDDSTPYDVKLMKKRAHVLHKMLEGSVQRFDYSVLTPFLPPKQEYVIFVRLTEVQKKLYQHYLDNFARRLGGRNVTLFADFQALQRIWTHPYVLRLNAEKIEKANEKKRLEASDSEGSLKDFIDDDSTSVSESSSNSSNVSDSDVECLDSDSEKVGAAKKRGTRANPIAEKVAEPVEEIVEEAAWWSEFINEEQFNDLRISTKLMLLFAILKESESIGDKVLVFSQSLYSLTLIEHFLNLMDEQSQKNTDVEHLNGHAGSWALGVDYFRLDGSTSAENRSIWSKIFNNPKNTQARLFLISTRAGGLGINLIGANRVIIFDASWNPSHDVQSIFRIYRFGQKKPCYVYRFLAAGTMEEKIYNRQVTKLSLACRVVDEQQIERHYSNTDLAELYQFDTCEDQSETLSLPKDRLLAEIFSKYKDLIVKCHEHDSLLENKEDEELDEEERKQAWAEYEEEKKGIRQQGYNNTMGNNYAFNQMLMSMNVMPEFQGVKALLQKDYPDVPPDHLDVLARKAMFDMYRQIDQHATLNSLNNFRDSLVPSQNAMVNPTIQGEIFRQQNLMMNQPQPNYYNVNQMPVYSGRGRPPKFTSVNNEIVTNPIFFSNAQTMQSLQSVPNDNEVQVLNDILTTPSNQQTPSNTNEK